METRQIKISKLKNNTGQIDGLPKNPRLLKNDKFQKLKKSLEDDPEMLDLRELIVIPLLSDFVVIGGNMRLRAMIELGYKEAPCKVLDEDTPIEKLKAYTIKDNIPYGENSWDDIANEWDVEQLVEWGLDIPNFDTDDSEAGKQAPKPTLTIEFVTTADLKEFTNAIQEMLPDGSFIR